MDTRTGGEDGGADYKATKVSGDAIVLDTWADAAAYARRSQGPAGRVLDLLTGLNLPMQIGALVGLIFCGEVCFRVPDLQQLDWPGHSVLAAAGVPARWRDQRAGIAYFNVPGRRARYASWLLDRAGLAHTHSPIPRRYRKGSRGGRKGSTRGTATLFDKIKSELFN